MASHQTVSLSAGRHSSPHAGACVMELASMLADEPFSDRPASVSPVVAALLRTYNDGLDDDRRQDLYPLAALVVGSARGRAIEEERASRCLNFASEVGRRLPSGRATIGLATAEASGSLAALAALATGPSPEVHERTLALARDLATLRPEPRRRHWPSWLPGRDPAQVVADVLDARARARDTPKEGGVKQAAVD